MAVKKYEGSNPSHMVIPQTSGMDLGKKGCLKLNLKHNVRNGLDQTRLAEAVPQTHVVSMGRLVHLLVAVAYIFIP